MPKSKNTKPSPAEKKKLEPSAGNKGQQPPAH
jgi:hypothetical protein